MNYRDSAATAECPTPRFEYFRGYPGRFEGERRRVIKIGLCVFGPLFLISLFGTACAAYSLAESSGWKVPLLLLGLATFSGWFAWGLWIALHVGRDTTIVPYFQKTLGDIHTFSQGHAVARSCQALDELAVQSDLEPLSSFGFNDDLAGEPLIWHPPARGLATFSGLLAALRDRPNHIPRQDQLIKELVAIEDAFQKASDQNVPFCLLLRTGDGTSALEWEQRKGICF